MVFVNAIVERKAMEEYSSSKPIISKDDVLNLVIELEVNPHFPEERSMYEQASKDESELSSNGEYLD